jgi:predicted flap endonuclease-1-like 5' DNA nuclease
MERNRSPFFTRLITLMALVLGFISSLIIVWVYRSRHPEEAEPVDVEALPLEELALKARAAGFPGMEAPGPAPGPEPDDLKRIEGIGPRISGVLQAAGIVTYGQLAASDADELTEILREEDPRLARLADPTTWPEQATLAAAGAWEVLEDLQGELTGGRRTGSASV